MSDDDDDALHDFDLSAWEAPAAPANLADAVLARLGATQVATDLAKATAIESDKRRRLVIAGVATGVVAAAAGVWLVVHDPRSQDHDERAAGALVADRARHVDLDAVSGDLDLGADVRWRPSGDGLRIEQRAGAATWRVASGHQLVIDAASVTNQGAVASIEATGASLRVEIQPMNMSDARVIGASALTSAAVALITVVVYEGHVKATSGGQTVIVEPGSRFEIKPDQPPAEPLHVGLAPAPLPATPDADLTITAGESVTIHSPDGTSTVRIRSSCQTDTGIAMTPPTSIIKGVVGLSAGRYQYEIRCDGGKTAANAGTIDVVRDSGHALPAEVRSTPIDADGRSYTISFQRQISPIRIHISKTASHYTVLVENPNAHMRFDSSTPTITIPGTSLRATTYNVSVELDGVAQPKITHLSIVPDAGGPIAWIDKPVEHDTWDSPIHVLGQTIPGAAVSIEGVQAPIDDHGRFAAVIAGADTLAIRIEQSQRGIHYYLRHAASHSHDATVDKVAIADRLTDSTGTQVIDGARPTIMACADIHSAKGTVAAEVHVGPDGKVEKTVILGSPTPELGACVAGELDKLVFDATAHGGTLTTSFVFAPAAKCDAEALRDAGVQDEAMGQHKQAVAKFKEWFACSPDPHAMQLLFMAACNANDFRTAHKSYKQLSTDLQQRVVVMCIRNHITKDALDAPLSEGLPLVSEKAGTLHLLSKPPADIYIDGRDTGLTTPVTGDKLRLEPGKHKVTFMVGEDRYTYPVQIKTGQTATISKELE